VSGLILAVRLARDCTRTVTAADLLCFRRMTDKHLEQLAEEIETSLQSGAVTEQDRTVLKRVHSELQAALAVPALASPQVGLRDQLRRAIEQLEGEHPRLTGLLSKSLDLLSDVGI
jgi:hypothetical protein